MINGVPALSSGCTVHWTGGKICSSFRVVPNAPKNSGQAPPSKNGAMPFEEAMKKLEGIVEAMESEELPLEELLAKYEEGTQLAKICQAKLAEAELKIQQLEKTASGEIRVKSLAPEEV